VILLDMPFSRLIEDWLARYTQAQWRGCRLEGWLFEGLEARRQAEAKLAEAGVSARLHSAYKPLVHAILEDIDTNGVVGAEIRYPVLPGLSAERFLLEAYPLADLLPGLRFIAEKGEHPVYTVTLRRAGGIQTLRIEAPNTWAADHQGLSAYSPCAWLRITRPNGEISVDQAERAEYQRLFDTAMDCIAQHPWGKTEPYFERLSLRADIPPLETPLPGGETASTSEALHEDLYFSVLEFFQHYSGRPPGDRGLQPGQIVPDIRLAEQPRLRITIEAFTPAGRLTPRQPERALNECAEPLTLSEVAHTLATLGGQEYEAPTRQGRRVLWRYFEGRETPVLISAAQHANETSGVIGALRAAPKLQGAFALLPLENPDGYALFEDLRAWHPNHMHHAARYSALGDDVAFREGPPAGESVARHEAIARSGAQLHINLHGYPSHEWTRPLRGYLPRGFESWTLPKGFFWVLQYHPGWAGQAQRLAKTATAKLAQAVPALAGFNRSQRARRAVYAASDNWPLFNGIPVMLRESGRELAPVSLITEFPDETLYGAAYRFAHTVQMHTVLAATAAWREINVVG
ncbi:conserved hypothetical protein, partial [Bordetella avium 197N]